MQEGTENALAGRTAQGAETALQRHHNDTAILDAALALAAEGVPVFPCTPKKAPLTDHGHQAATTNTDTIREWWDKYPAALVGVPTGKVSGLLTVDIDPDGADWYRDNTDKLAACRVHKTQRGHHLLYRMPSDEVRNSASKITPGVDVRGEGGYIIWWPAHGLTATGDMSDITEPPSWLMDTLRTAPTERPSEPEHGDIVSGQRNDYLSREAFRLRRQGSSVEQIYRVITAMNAARCVPPLDNAELRKIAEGKSSVSADEAGKSDTCVAFRLCHVSELEFQPPRYLIRGLLEADTLALIFGDPGCMKSFLAIGWTCCIATGKAFHGHEVLQAAPVIYIAGEGHNGLSRRFKAWEIRNQVSLQDAPLYISTMPAALCDPASADAVAAAVDDIAAKHGAPALVVVDTVARNFGPGDESKTMDMSHFVSAADRIRARHKAAVLLVHHTGHADKSRARGSMVLKGALDAEYRMDKDETGTVRVEATKMKDAPHPEPLAFRAATVDLGITDDQGHPVTSAVLDSTSYEPPPTKGKQGRGKWQTLAMEALADLHKRHRGNVASNGRDPDTARVSVTDWRTECVDGRDMPRGKFYDVKKTLGEQGRITIEHGFVTGDFPNPVLDD